MRVNYQNINGQLLPETKAVLLSENRAFRYGDAIFETMLWEHGRIRLLPYHVERLQQSMQVLQMNGWEDFDVDFIDGAVRELLRKNEWEPQACRIRLQVYRDGGGLYSPVTNRAGYVLSCTPILIERGELQAKTGLIVDVYTEHYKAASSLSRLKSTNSLIFVLAGLYRKKRGLDEVVILNQDQLLCESLSSNIFISYNNQLFTPALGEGCVAGVMRRRILELAPELGVDIVEAKIDPQILHDADEVFLTNALRGVQWVMGYKQKRYFKHWSTKFQEALQSS